MPKPPWKHMAPGDIPLFASYVLSEEGKAFKSWEFDVRVGKGHDPGPVYEDPWRRAAIALSQLRIDAVGWTWDGPTLFEVKPDAGLSAFGQIAAYRYFFEKDKGIHPKAGLITDARSSDLCELLNAFDIECHLVRPATPAELLSALRVVCPSCCLTYDDIRYIYEPLPTDDEN